jgi:hypothetical protein
MSLQNLFTKGSKVMLVANVHRDNILVTPFEHENGNPKTDNRDRPIGSIMVEQNVRVLNGTFMNGSRRVAFISGTIAELEAIIKENRLKAGSEIDGKIIQKESLKPFYPGQPAKINPATGDAIEFEVNGTMHPIYMQQLYTSDENAKDVLIRSVEEVEALLNAKNINTITQQHANGFQETARVPADEIGG